MTWIVETTAPRAVNVVLLGVLSQLLDFPASTWEETIQRSVKPKTLETNLKAFELGRDVV